MKQNSITKDEGLHSSPDCRQTGVAGSAEIERRSVLEKYWRQFRITTGLRYEPMSEKAYEYFEMAMQEYAEILIKNQHIEIVQEIGDRNNVIKEVYNKWHEFDNDLMFVEWLAKEVG